MLPTNPYLKKLHFLDALSRRTSFWDTAFPCGSENSHNVVQLNPNEVLMSPLKKISPERIRAIARDPNIDLQ